MEASDSDEKDLSSVRRKVEEYSTSLTSRMLYCDEAQSGSPGLTVRNYSKVAQIYENVGPLMSVCDDTVLVDLIKQLIPSSPYAQE